MGSLAVTYFRERKLTIIGALLFHGPVREGKGWYQKAMSARRNLYAGRGLGRQAQNGDRRLFVVTAYELHAVLLQGYRIKPYGQLVSVSLTHYCASTPDLSTSWSSTTL